MLMINEKKMHEVIPTRNSPISPNRRHSDISVHGSLPTEVRIEIAKNKIQMKETEYENTYKSCCLGSTDKRLCQYVTQSVVGVSIMIFCAYNLTYNSDCQSDPAFWSLLSSTVSHFLTKKVMSNKK